MLKKIIKQLCTNEIKYNKPYNVTLNDAKTIENYIKENKIPVIINKYTGCHKTVFIELEKFYDKLTYK